MTTTTKSSKGSAFKTNRGIPPHAHLRVCIHMQKATQSHIHTHLIVDFLFDESRQLSHNVVESEVPCLPHGVVEGGG